MLSFDEYRAAPGENLSRLKLLSKSPKAYLAQQRHDTAALSAGRLVHTAVLEPDAFAHEVCVYPGKVRRGKEWDSFQAENRHKSIVTAAEHELATNIAGSVHSHPWASCYFEEGTPEVSVFWRHTIGIDCKSRIDWFREDLVLDLKTARDITPDGFARQCASLNYHAQMAFYHDAAKALDGKDRKVVLLVVEKEPPFDLAPYVLPEEALAAGRRMYQDWLLLLKKCQGAGHYPGVAEQETELHLPDWAFSEFDDGRLIIDGVEVAV